MSEGEFRVINAETGGGSIYQLAVISLLIALAVAIGRVVVDQQEEVRLQVKADVLALGGAQSLKENWGTQMAGKACETVSELVADNEIRMESCVATENEVWVCVENRGNALYRPAILCSHAGIGATIPALVFSDTGH